MKMSSAEYHYRLTEEIEMFDLANGTDFCESREIRIVRINDSLEETGDPAVFGVNWCCKGTVDAKETNNFANMLMAAACLANHLTSKKFIVDYSIDSSEFIKKMKGETA